MSVLKEYRKLTQSELIEADHYAETGNREGLRKMARLSNSREQSKDRTILIKDRRHV